METLSKFKAFLHDFWHTADATRIEVAMRLTLVCFPVYILSIANIPKAVPASTSLVVGAVGATIAVVVPMLMFSTSLIVPLCFNVFVIAMCFSTALLAAGTVSDRLLVAMQAVITWIMTGCFFGADVTLTAPFINGIIAVTAFFTLSFLLLIQDGFSATVMQDAVQQLGEITDWVRAALSAACELADQAPSCWEDQFPTLADVYLSVELPAVTGAFAGQTTYLTVSSDDSIITTDIPGGLWVVSGLWTWKGIDNPLAGFRNFLISLSSACVCVLVGILFPPFRTSRSILSRALVPSVLSVSAQSDSLELLDKNRGQVLLNGLNSMNGGKVAVVTTFEPHIITAPFKFTVPLLKDLLVMTESDEKTKDLHAELSVLSTCAKALVSSEGAAMESLKQLKADTRTSSQEGYSFLTPPIYLHGCCEKVLDVTIAWLDALIQPQHPCPCLKESSKNLLHTYLPWLLAQLCTFKRMAIVLTLPFRPKTWNLRHTLWSLKFTLGSVALFVASVYWNEFSNFSIKPKYGTSGAVFSGWEMLA